MSEETIPYYQSVKFLRKILKPNTVVYFDELLDQHKNWQRYPHSFKEQTGTEYRGVFYRSRANIAKNTNLKKGAQMAAERILTDMGLITIIPQTDHPNWYRVNLKKLNELYHDFMAEEARKIEEEKFAKLPLDYEKFIADYIKPDEGPSSNKTAPPPDSRTAPLQNADGNKNIEARSNKKNLVGKATYGSNGSEATETDSNCIIDTQNSCIKIDSCTNAPPRSAHSGTGDEIQDIVNEYNSAVGLKQARGDYEAVKNNLETFRKIRPYLTPTGIDFAWRNFGDEKARNLKFKRLSALVSFDVLDTFVEKRELIYSYMADKLDNSLSKVIRYFHSSIEDLTGDLKVNILGELETKNGEILTKKDHRRTAVDIYNRFLEPKLLQDEDLHDMIIDMEVPSWII